MNRRCDTCGYWVQGEQWGEEEDRHPDDRRGGCHRYAPRPTLGDFEYEVMKHLTMLTWRGAGEEDRKTDFENWEECYLMQPSWPQTHGADWCGEWKLKE